MDLIQSILMGIVQGLSEFLPISSSAHLVFTSNFYKVFRGIEIVQESNQEVFLDIMLHFGTLIAVLIFFRKEIWAILKALYFGLKNSKKSDKEEIVARIARDTKTDMKLDEISSDVKEVKDTVKNIQNDVKDHEGRIVKLEASYKAEHKRLDEVFHMANFNKDGGNDE